MKINNNAWHFKLYNFWHNLKYGWKLDSGTVNLCPYVRTVLVYWWMRLLFITKAAYVTIPVLLFEIPRWAGMFSYDFKMGLYFGYAAIAGAVVFIGSLAGIEYFFEKSNSGQSFKQIVGNKMEPIATVLDAAHGKICPVLNIGE